MENAILDRFLQVAKVPVYVVIFVIFLTTAFGTAHLVMIFFEHLLNENPHKYIIDLSEMFILFNSALTIVVGYELIKALVTIIRSHEIPTQTIIKIAMIALLNKIVTTDHAGSQPLKVLAIAGLAVALGAAFYLFSKDSQTPDGAKAKHLL
jgi:uncharacterized membrane protein (DUF373 family)